MALLSHSWVGADTWQGFNNGLKSSLTLDLLPLKRNLLEQHMNFQCFHDEILCSLCSPLW
jgi:hypothetical protein